MNIDMESIGNRIKGRRKELHLTQTDIKAVCGISSGSLSEIENGNRTPSVIIFHALAQVLECSMDWLATGEYPDAKGKSFSVSEDNKTDVECELLDAFRQLEYDDQEEIMDILYLKLNRTKRKRK
ncbi:MAG: helix-turn-helix domain-containing protein [Eubacterium sp.]|nr:helix-turn-helix domain-containing protein [Eubacterium sp.]